MQQNVKIMMKMNNDSKMQLEKITVLVSTVPDLTRVAGYYMHGVLHGVLVLVCLMFEKEISSLTSHVPVHEAYVAGDRKRDTNNLF